ncbi:MAG: hypothetical protein LM590_16510 [Thermofilum sp.]|jgi:hypothetical protein|nr:hypothetical protein [Thermofilum sp.]
MTRRSFRPSSLIRYRAKLYRLYSGVFPAAVALELVDAMVLEWSLGFGEYHKAWVDLLESGVIPAGTPRMDLAKWRAGLCFTIKMTKKGYSLTPGTPDRQAIVHHLTRVIGLAPELAEKLVDFVSKRRTP